MPPLAEPTTPEAAPAKLRHDPDLPPVLLPYQQRLLGSTALRVVLYEKSRRIGASWAAASEAVTVSAAARGAGGMDTLYIGYNLDMAREFIDDCAFWAKHLAVFAGAVAEIEEFVFRDNSKDGDRDIQAFRIRFASGFDITALSSRPRSLRGKQGFVIIDEAAFHDDLAELIKAAMALLIWGGKVWIISTHDGSDNYFNELIEEARSGKKPYTVLRTTFDDALKDGLYRRICLSQGWEWSAETEAKWAEEIRGFYGDDAAEELDVIPSQGSNVWLTRALIDECSNAYFKVVYKAFEKGFELKPLEAREDYVDAWLEDEIAPLLDELDAFCDSVFGGDFARTGDLSVFWVGQIARNDVNLRVPLSIELRNCPFAQQEQILNFVIDRLPRFRAGAVDARGIGAQLAEGLADRYGQSRIEQVMATREWYRENMPPLKARFEDKTIEIARDPDTRNDLRGVKVDKGVPMVPEGARTRSQHGGWRHGDAAIAAVMVHRASAIDAAPIEFQSAGRRRAGFHGFDDTTGAPESGRIDHQTGFGTVSGGNDFGGY